VADLVDHARALRACLVCLPERGDLFGERVLDIAASGLGELRIVEPVEQFADFELRGEHRSARGFRRMRRQHELERDAPRGVAQLPGGDACRVEFLECLVERFGRHAPLDGVLSPAPDPMMLFGKIRELEVERERADQAALFIDRQCLDDRLDGFGVAGAGGLADAFLGVEERLPFLLPDDVAEDGAQQADVPAEWAL